MNQSQVERAQPSSLRRRARRGPVEAGAVVACNTCGKPFAMTPSQIRRRDYKCSPCVDAGRALRGKPRRIPKSARLNRRSLIVQKVKRAIKSGRLVKKPCEVCGAQKAIAHHEDYTKPLHVKWLCQLHHWAEHKALAARGWVSNL